ncbi:BA14K family protein [Brevundimonas lenta]|uniref:Lectin-like protein BA14k n=1 Tax=Brevundimonas lenta TaxID=424796 RepID=A0A7W6JD08_9CAUL|nr:BA14K family protein [Brevundimonas lenta]MBB4081901.1 hypothetical protein [Brevundimonas lenta]
MRLALTAAAGLALLAAPAAAQSWNPYSYSGQDRYDGRYDYDRRDTNAVPSNFDWRSQLDRPGDYRCDAYWDANRDDCGDRWRDQRRRVSPQARRDYRELAGYSRDEYSRYGHGDYGYGYSQGRYGYRSHQRGYGSAYGYGHGSGGTTYEGAYGRPDVVFPGGGRAYAGGRDVRRMDWCRANYRSYDPASGYYRGYSGELIFCG